MKKIGILTFHRAVNYGAVLQTYALQHQIQNMGAECKVIDYQCDAIEDCYKPFRIEKEQLFKSVLKLPFRYYWTLKRKRRFQNFLNTKIHLTQRYSSSDLAACNSEFDTFITGSDQVWNSTLTKMDTTYLLDFVRDPCKKASYAASFGFDEIPEALKNTYEKLLSDFRQISVREQQGADIIRKLLNREVSVNIDPVLLLSQQEWQQVASPVRQNDYIFVYTMEKTSTMINFIENLSQKTGCSIIWFTMGLRRPIREGKVQYIHTGSPEQFVGYIAGAKYVVTNSFHGTAFSILFHKKFFVEYLPEPSKANSRLENILNLFQLKERLILNGQNDLIQQGIDYNAVDRVLNEERKKAIHYLKKIVG